ncbi:hypothetical protein Pint_19021 [Pistacia integerrima]|uniref:Uncharacterized protein n=1 Tax=Pistacia integerrima TaxID=434235 RepID=A0ACC0YX58_9ROSI|nr:hypothetical protein Pint_19021 [Pistacia integerrima]
MGLELSNRPFLWVLRPDITDKINDAYPEGFTNRAVSRGHIVSWAPQQKVLAHPSIACFISHCGWNSTIEAIGNGVLYLCWPYFADQMHNENYILNETGVMAEGTRSQEAKRILVVSSYFSIGFRHRKLNYLMSSTILDRTQFHELALGLELSNRPFLWVVHPNIIDDMSDAYPEGFLDRVASRGHIVSWAPQQKVLAHTSISCFLSHCGWNSTMEGVCNGLPFLCWPYFADQFLNRTYICDIWKVGLAFTKDEIGIIRREEIRSKVDQLLDNAEYRTRVLHLKEIVMNNIKEGGCSYKNLMNFIEWIKE